MTASDIATAYAGRWTSQAEAEAIRNEHDRRREMQELWNEYTGEHVRKRKAKRRANFIAAALVSIFLVLAIVWGK